MHDLDEQSDSISGKGASYRERGCVLRVVVSYENSRKTWIGTRYEVKSPRNVKYSFTQFNLLSVKA